MQDRFGTHGMHDGAKERHGHLDQPLEFPELEGNSCKGSDMGDLGTVPSRAIVSYRMWFVPSKCEQMDQQMISSWFFPVFEQLFSFPPKRTVLLLQQSWRLRNSKLENQAWRGSRLAVEWVLSSSASLPEHLLRIWATLVLERKITTKCSPKSLLKN